MGVFKNAGSLSYFIVNDAGEKVSMDKPEAALHMINSFIFNKIDEDLLYKF